MSRTRTVALLLLAAGCGKPDATPPAVTKPATPARPATPPSFAFNPPSAVPPPSVDLPAATAAATKLLADLAAGTADPSAVEPAFQKTLAGGDEGKASWATEQHLRGFTGKVATTPPAVAPLPDGSVLAVAPPLPGAGRVVARLAKAGDGWKAVWLHQGPAGPVPELTGDPGTLGTRFAVAAFVETALTNQPRLAEAGLTAAGRAALAPPLGNDPLGFSRGILSQKLANFRGAATGYTFTADGPTVTGELLGPGGDRRPFKLALTGGVVSDFEPR